MTPRPRRRQVARFACGPCGDRSGRPRFVGDASVAGATLTLNSATTKTSRERTDLSRRQHLTQLAYDPEYREVLLTGELVDPESIFYGIDPASDFLNDPSWWEAKFGPVLATLDQLGEMSTEEMGKWDKTNFTEFPLRAEHTGTVFPLRCPRHGPLVVAVAEVAALARRPRPGRPKVVTAHPPPTG